eukprot:1590387-Pyramimonas_sp.AAC.1
MVAARGEDEAERGGGPEPYRLQKLMPGDTAGEESVLVHSEGMGSDGQTTMSGLRLTSCSRTESMGVYRKPLDWRWQGTATAQCDSVVLTLPPAALQVRLRYYTRARHGIFADATIECLGRGDGVVAVFRAHSGWGWGWPVAQAAVGGSAAMRRKLLEHSTAVQRMRSPYGLQRVWALAGCAAGALQRLASWCRVVRHSRGDRLFSRDAGAECAALYVVVTGALRVRIRVTPDGSALARPGEHGSPVKEKFGPKGEGGPEETEETEETVETVVTLRPGQYIGETSVWSRPSP